MLSTTQERTSTLANQMPTHNTDTDTEAHITPEDVREVLVTQVETAEEEHRNSIQAMVDNQSTDPADATELANAIVKANDAVNEAKRALEAHDAAQAMEMLQATGDEVFAIVKGYYEGKDLSPETIAFDFAEDTVVFNGGVQPKAKAPKTTANPGTAGRKRIQWSQKEVTNGFETLPVKAAIDKYLDEETKTYVIGFYVRAIPALKEATGQDWKFVGPDQPA